MKIVMKAGLVGFLLTLATLDGSTAAAAISLSVPQANGQNIEGRLNRITAAICDRESRLPEAPLSLKGKLVALGWADGGRGGWVNVNPWRNWRNGWRDGGGFLNRGGWVNGGFRNGGFRNAGFLNRY